MDDIMYHDRIYVEKHIYLMGYRVRELALWKPM